MTTMARSILLRAIGLLYGMMVERHIIRVKAFLIF